MRWGELESRRSGGDKRRRGNEGMKANRLNRLEKR
jgi:hypothetical protein